MNKILGFIKMKWQMFILRLADRAGVGQLLEDERQDYEEEIEELEWRCSQDEDCIRELLLEIGELKSENFELKRDKDKIQEVKDELQTQVMEYELKEFVKLVEG